MYVHLIPGNLGVNTGPNVQSRLEPVESNIELAGSRLEPAESRFKPVEYYLFYIVLVGDLFIL